MNANKLFVCIRVHSWFHYNQHRNFNLYLQIGVGLYGKKMKRGIMPKEETTDGSKDKYDNAAKIVFQERPMDVIQFATGYTSPTIEPLKTSLEIRLQ